MPHVIRHLACADMSQRPMPTEQHNEKIKVVLTAISFGLCKLVRSCHSKLYNKWKQEIILKFFWNIIPLSFHIFHTNLLAPTGPHVQCESGLSFAIFNKTHLWIKNKTIHLSYQFLFLISVLGLANLVAENRQSGCTKWNNIFFNKIESN